MVLMDINYKYWILTIISFSIISYWNKKSLNCKWNKDKTDVFYDYYYYDIQIDLNI